MQFNNACGLRGSAYNFFKAAQSYDDNALSSALEDAHKEHSKKELESGLLEARNCTVRKGDVQAEDRISDQLYALRNPIRIQLSKTKQEAVQNGTAFASGFVTAALLFGASSFFGSYGDGNESD